METLYTVKQAADMLGVSVSTLRRIADDMSSILPDYQPVQGERRTFTADDVKTLSALHTRLQASPDTTRAALLVELSQPDSEPFIIPDTLPTPKPQEAPGSPKHSEAIAEALHPTQNVLAPFLQAHADTQRQIEKLSAQIAEIQSRPAPSPDRITSLVAVGVLAVGIAAAALLSWPQAAVIGSLLALLVHIGTLAIRPRG